MKQIINHLNQPFDEYGDVLNKHFYGALALVLAMLIAFTVVRIREIKRSKSCTSQS